MEDELEHFVAIGADSVFTKPMKPTALEKILSMILKHDFEAPYNKKLMINEAGGVWIDASQWKFQ